jgi:hypothetical protein
MTIYRDRITGKLKNKLQLKKQSNISLPSIWDSNVYDALNIDPVVQAEQPSYNRATQQTELNTFATLIEGEWTQEWTIVDMTMEEIQANNLVTSEIIKNRRNALLEQSDWTQVIDAPVDQAAWATYRQALRDITLHANFPYLQASDWPETV